ncbi:MAG: DUF4388 domain-containing protein [Deltaproteobacteria bacterium]|nr:DUF4388 domain-containing protein [Deltaproteobacteria bacterium]
MKGKTTADRLLAAKLITPEHHAAAVYRQRTSGLPADDFLIELGAIREEELLKFLAAELRTQYLTTERLRSATLPRPLLEMVPLKLVEATQTMPIRYDQRTRVLAVLTADPENLDALSQVRAAAGVRDVQAVLARPAAVRASIARWYRNDPQPFQDLADGAAIRAADLVGPSDDLGIDWLERTDGGDRDHWTIREPARPVEAEDVPGRAAAPRAVPAARTAPAAGSADASGPPTPSVADPGAVTAADYLETLNVLVSLLENSRAELRGHSAAAARHAGELATRVGVPVTEVQAVVVAAYLHDLGKGTPFHLTALNVAEWEGHRDAARKRFEIPLRLMETVQFRPESVRAVLHMYERFDGTGFPTGLRGKEIPLGGRILAIVDTYADLTQNTRNPFRRTLGAVEAVGVLDRYRDVVFDGDLIDLFRTVVAGSDLRQRLLSGHRPILVVDDDVEQSAALELRLLSRGFDVHVARSAEAALQCLQEADVHLVVSEVDLEPFDGFELLRRARGVERARQVPFLFFTARAAAEEVARAFELGAADYVVKPSTTEVLVAKIRQTLERRPAESRAAGGVSGSLADMSLPDLVQILSQGRKSGKLTVTGADGHKGEIEFLEGRVANAAYQGRTGQEAFYAMLVIQQGTFALDAEFRPTAVVIGESAEALLLEGMRRIDEAGR